MNESGVNNITKTGALEWWSRRKRDFQPDQLADLIYRVTVCGHEYENLDKDPYYMSYICRLFNITEHGVTKQQNRIKSRYRKYRDNADIQNVIANIIRQNPNGFTKETPRFEDLLKNGIANTAEIAEEDDYYFEEENYQTGEQQVTRKPEKIEWDKVQLFKYGKIAAIVIVIFCVIGACSFVRDKLGDLSDFISSDYEFEAFTYEGVLYAGNKKMNKPDGVCAGIPMRSSGTTYSLGEYDGSEIEGFGIICDSDIPLQSKLSESKDASDYDEAQLEIKMGQMEESVLNGYGIVYNSLEEIVIGKYKDGQLKKYGCKVSLDENGDILSVDVVKGDKVKKHLENGTYKGITYYPEEGLIVIDEFEFTISAGQITMKTEGAAMSIKDRQWTFDLFNADTDEGIYVDYALGENIKCEVTTNDAKGVLVNESEMPITYGTE